MNLRESYKDAPIFHSIEVEIVLDNVLRSFPLLFGILKTNKDN